MTASHTTMIKPVRRTRVCIWDGGSLGRAVAAMTDAHLENEWSKNQHNFAKIPDVGKL